MNAIFISTAPEVNWNPATGRHGAPLWNTAFEALTAQTESGQLFDTGVGGEENLNLKRERYLVTAPFKIQNFTKKRWNNNKN